MKPYSVALLVYGEIHSDRNALTEEKYKDLADAFLSNGYHIQSVLYTDAQRDILSDQLLNFDAVLVWVNPIEQGKDRRKLDSLLLDVSNRGCFVSTHPEVIVKMGTKEVLYKTKDFDWGCETNLYTSYADFVAHFSNSLQQSGTKVLKQCRGNGGNGVYKVIKGLSAHEVVWIHAKNSHQVKKGSWNEFHTEFEPYFFDNGILIEQAWNENLANGMVRCYLSGTTVAGFGYQEINALYPSATDACLPPSKRYYFTQNCGLFSDLKQLMEENWVPQLQAAQDISDERMPVIWDADFFINYADRSTAIGKYTLCEINVSCVSPFPPSAIECMVEKVGNRIRKSKERVS